MNIAEIYSNKINEEAVETASVNLSSGQLVLGTYRIKDGKVANKKVSPGTYRVDAFWVSEDDMDSLNASVGLDMIVVNFSDKPIDRWEEATDGEGNALIASDCVEFLLYDQSGIDELESSEEEIKKIKEICYADGMGEFGEGNAVNVYVGEDSIDNRIFWALDAENNPVKLVGYFDYNFGGGEE